MRIVKIETIKKQRRIVYEIPLETLVKFGPAPVFCSRLKREDSNVLEQLDDLEEDFEEEERDESSDEISSVEWLLEDDEL